MSEALGQLERRYTYADYCRWGDDERWELIDGEAYCLAPAPSATHQRIVVELITQLREMVRDGECEAFVAPFDVRLPDEEAASRGAPDDAIDSVVQPDVLVVCDPEKIEERGCLGAPDFVVEVLSPHTGSKDLIRKTDLYERRGVREYWIVQPAERVIIVRVLGENGKWSPPRFVEGKGKLPVAVLPGVAIDLDRLFPPLPKSEPGPATRQKRT